MKWTTTCYFFWTQLVFLLTNYCWALSHCYVCEPHYTLVICSLISLSLPIPFPSFSLAYDEFHISSPFSINFPYRFGSFVHSFWIQMKCGEQRNEKKCTAAQNTIKIKRNSGAKIKNTTLSSIAGFSVAKPFFPSFLVIFLFPLIYMCARVLNDQWKNCFCTLS